MPVPAPVAAVTFLLTRPTSCMFACMQMLTAASSTSGAHPDWHLQLLFWQLFKLTRASTVGGLLLMP